MTLEPTQPPIQWVPGSFLEVKRLGSEVNHSPSSNAKVNNEWSGTAAPPICLHSVDWQNFFIRGIIDYPSACV